MENREMIRYFYETIVSEGRIGEVGKFVSDDCEARNGEQVLRIGLEGMVDHLKGVRTTYPDLKIKVIRQHEDGEFVISEIVMEGTHAGEWLGIKPTGKKLGITGVNIDRVRDGKMTEHGGAANVFDTFWVEKIIRAWN